MKEALKNTTIQGIIAIIIIVVGFLFLAFIQARESITVSIVNLMIMVVSYYFGSSRSTTKKDETIASMAQNNN